METAIVPVSDDFQDCFVPFFQARTCLLLLYFLFSGDQAEKCLAHGCCSAWVFFKQVTENVFQLKQEEKRHLDITTGPG